MVGVVCQSARSRSMDVGTVLVLQGQAAFGT
jgi:hypothetical protein